MALYFSWMEDMDCYKAATLRFLPDLTPEQRRAADERYINLCRSSESRYHRSIAEEHDRTVEQERRKKIHERHTKQARRQVFRMKRRWR